MNTKMFFRVISIVLINSFLLLDAVWAGGTEISVAKPTEMLSAPVQISQQTFNVSFGKLFYAQKNENIESEAKIVNPEKTILNFSQGIMTSNKFNIGKIGTALIFFLMLPFMEVAINNVIPNTFSIFRTTVSQAQEAKLYDGQDVDYWISGLGRDEQKKTDDIKTLIKIGKPAVPVLIQMLGDEDWHSRATTAWALGKIKDANAVPALSKALWDENAKVRAAAVWALGELKDERAVFELSPFRLDEDWQVRAAVRLALIKIGEPAVQLLINDLNDRYSQDRITAIWLLGEIKNARAVPVIKSCLREKRYNNSEEYSAMTEALKKIEKANPLLIMPQTKENTDIQVYESEGNKSVVRSYKKSAWSMKLIEDGVSESTINALLDIGNPAVPTLMRVLKPGNYYDSVRATAAEALGEIKDTQAVPALIEALRDEYFFVRAATSWALGEIRDKRAVSPLIGMLCDKDYHVRAAAAEALGKIKDTQAVPVLIEALRDKDYHVRAAAATALGEIRDKRAVHALIHGYSPVTVASIEALGELKDTQAVPVLVEAFKNKDYQKREAAARALGKIKDTRSAQALIEALGDGDSNVRAAVALALDSLGWKDFSLNNQINYFIAKQDYDALVKVGKPAIPALILALKDENYYVRASAAEVLGKIKAVEAVPALSQALKAEVGEAAAWALGEIKDAHAVPVLIQALGAAPGVRYAAAWALGEIKDKRAVPALIQALREGDGYWPARRFAARALGEIRDTQAVPALIEVLKEERHSLVKRAATEALIQIGTPAVGELVKVVAEHYEAAINSETTSEATYALAYILKNSGSYPIFINKLLQSTEFEYLKFDRFVGILAKDKRDVFSLLEAILEEMTLRKGNPAETKRLYDLFDYIKGKAELNSKEVKEIHNYNVIGDYDKGRIKEVLNSVSKVALTLVPIALLVFVLKQIFYYRKLKKTSVTKRAVGQQDYPEIRKLDNLAPTSKLGEGIEANSGKIMPKSSNNVQVAIDKLPSGIARNIVVENGAMLVGQAI
ncbi:MAG: HEAT repeat domain-containing protein [Candidatus Omnitrophica bacterium]|nr:HEAT repeat domain-containing protein [Candidatus Omnitrophota bacterium]